MENIKKIELNQEIMSIYSKAMDKANRLQTADIIDETDCIQEAILAILEKQEMKAQKVNDNNHLFNRLKRQKKWDLYRKNKKRIEKLECHFEAFEFNPNDESIDIFGNEEKTGFNETVDLIKSKLSHEDYMVFELYYLQDMTLRTIAKKLNVSFKTVGNLINKITNHIMRLKITEIFETRYLMTGGTCKGKWPEKGSPPSACQAVSVNDYIPAQPAKPMRINDTEYAMELNIRIETKHDYYGNSDGIAHKV